MAREKIQRASQRDLHEVFAARKGLGFVGFLKGPVADSGMQVGAGIGSSLAVGYLANREVFSKTETRKTIFDASVAALGLTTLFLTEGSRHRWLREPGTGLGVVLTTNAANKLIARMFSKTKAASAFQFYGLGLGAVEAPAKASASQFQALVQNAARQAALGTCACATCKGQPSPTAAPEAAPRALPAPAQMRVVNPTAKTAGLGLIAG